MKILLISMPDVVPLVIHESAIHMPNLGIASIGANISEEHEVHIVDLIRKRNNIRKYLTRVLKKTNPGLVGLSAMTWQYDTCIKLIRLIKNLLPDVKIVIGGYHATLMNEEVAGTPESELIDFIVRGEGEEAFRRLTDALEGKDRLEDIPSLSYKENGRFVHNSRGAPLDLSQLRLPIRDKRRLTWGYHLMNFKIEVMETSRGCTRSCSFCSIRNMYGRTFRTFSTERVLSDLDDIYYRRKTRWVFIADDNLVLNPKRVIALCDRIIEKRYGNLSLVAQADCISMAKNEDMVRKMALAGFRSIFLGIENVSKENLETVEKGDIVSASKKAIANCHKYGMMVVGGLIFGFPNDDEEAIIRNYQFLNELEADGVSCQILTPYPKTKIREYLIKEGLVVNTDDYKWYNGLLANVRTRHLEADRLHYLFWYHRQKVLGWWKPSDYARKKNTLWTSIWISVFKPVMKLLVGRTLRKYGWEGRYQRELKRLTELNSYKDI